MVTRPRKRPDPFSEDKLLEIAQVLWQCREVEKVAKGLCAVVSHRTHAKGQTVALVDKMIIDGLIAYEADGKPYFVTPFANIKKHVLGKGEDKDLKTVASKSVTDTMTQAVKDEAATSVEQYIVLGKAIWQGLANWAVKKGITLDELSKMSPHTIVLEALEKADRVDELEIENASLRDQVIFLQGETDPILRLKKAIHMIERFLVFATLADEIGLNIDAVIPSYEKAITGYLMGVPNA